MRRVRTVRHIRMVPGLWALSLMLAWMGCRGGGGTETSTTGNTTAVPAAIPLGSPLRLDPSLLAQVAPLPVQASTPTQELTETRIRLGQRLFFEPRLSRTRTIACASCHQPSMAGADGLPHPTYLIGVEHPRNTPTLWNAGFNAVPGWDGRRFDDLERFILKHLLAGDGNQSDPGRVERGLLALPGYAPLLRTAYPGETGNADLVARALGAYVRSLRAPAALDRFLAGDTTALTPEQQRGFDIFLRTGCATCHGGPNLGGQFDRVLGAVSPWPVVPADQGRFHATGKDPDRMHYRVPSLRNVTRTAPYLHDGSMTALDQVVAAMARHQLGKELDGAEMSSILAFLTALEGDPPAELLAFPGLPDPDKMFPRAPDPTLDTAPLTPQPPPEGGSVDLPVDEADRPQPTAGAPEGAPRVRVPPPAIPETPLPGGIAPGAVRPMDEIRDIGLPPKQR